jgi:indolepyruvate ferredoxin oxidoreductase
MGVDPRFLASSGREVFTGNELLVKGALETPGGVHLMTGYPGSPVAGFFDVLSDIAPLLKDKGIRAFQANNEALSVAAINGSQMAPLRGMTAFKSVGTQVASDALALGNLAGAHPEGGAVIVSGEDPWCDSTQVPADSRFLFEHLRMAVVEPGSIQELKDWVGKSFELSRAAGLYIGYIVTVAHADGGGTVEVHPNHFPAVNMKHRVEMVTSAIPTDQTVLLPPRTWKRELQMNERFALTIAKARELGLNRIEPAVHGTADVAPIGFIVTGMGGPYLQHVLEDIGLAGHFPVLHMGMTYPVDTQIVAEFSKLCRSMIVIEERRSFLEKNIRDSLSRDIPGQPGFDIASRLYGKSFPTPAHLGDIDHASSDKPLTGIPEVRGLNPSLLATILIPLIKSTTAVPALLRNGRLTAELDRIRRASKPKLQVFNDRVIARTPTFCPGCPHRDSSSVLLDLRKNFADAKYMQQHHKRKPVDLVAHGDTGCYTMLMFAPTEQLMHNYSGMGLGGGTGSGIDPFITNKQIVFMGDGTFFHSGQVAISNAIKAGQDLTFIILENGTTAMTGHQEHPGTEADLLGNRSFIQDIETVCLSMKGTSPLTVKKVNPADRDLWYKTLEKTILADGVKVLIADKECGITYHRREGRQERKTIKEKGYLPYKAHMNVTPEVCENCLECTKATACPGLITSETDYGKKIDTDLTWCVNDGACERVRTSNEYGDGVKPCPSFEQIIVKRQKRKRYLLPNMELAKLPEPTPVTDMTAPGTTWRAHLAGVGGMGIGVVGALVVRAGHKEGHRVIFQDKKGLAIRNGGVYGQITFIAQGGTPVPTAPANPTGWIPYGKADLLLGVDILEAARATDPRELFRVASKDRTAAVLNMHKQPTVYALLGKQDFDVDALRQEIFDTCREDLSFAKNLADICEQRLGSKQFVNIMMLGVAFQLGLIPVSLSSIAWAIKDTIRRDHRRNLKAFNIGRKLALEPRALPVKPEPTTWQQLVTNKQRIIRKSRLIGGEALSIRFERLVRTTVESMPALDAQSHYDLAIRIYDLMMWAGNLHYPKRYIDAVHRLYKQDRADRHFAATRAVIWNLAKLMLIKDEPYVAYLLTRLEKKQRDITKYGIDTANGDYAVYRHHTSPEFPIGKYRLRLKITTTDWQLKLVSKLRILRKLPGWHRRDSAFLDWYFDLLGKVKLANSAEYAQAVTVLKSPEPVTGYREVRYPKMDAAKTLVAQELARPAIVPADDRNVSQDVVASK